jgi:hypothetical protein
MSITPRLSHPFDWCVFLGTFYKSLHILNRGHHRGNPE